MGTVLQHYLNPLHIYCRLRDMGITKGAASLLCRIYEQTIYSRFSVNYRTCNTMEDFHGRQNL